MILTIELNVTDEEEAIKNKFEPDSSAPLTELHISVNNSTSALKAPNRSLFIETVIQNTVALLKNSPSIYPFKMNLRA